jgi:hypothetical protein
VAQNLGPRGELRVEFSRCSGLLRVAQARNSLAQPQLRVAYSSLRLRSRVLRSQSGNGIWRGQDWCASIGAFAEAGLGSREDALISIIPSFRTNSILPLQEKVHDTVLSLAKDRRRSGRFTEGEDLLRWLYYNLRDTGPPTRETVGRELGELYCRTIRNPKDKIRDFDYRGIL